MEPAQRNPIARFAGSESAKLTCMPLSLFHRSLFANFIVRFIIYFISLRNLTNFFGKVCSLLYDVRWEWLRLRQMSWKWVFHSEASAAAIATTTTRETVQRVVGEKVSHDSVSRSSTAEQCESIKTFALQKTRNKCLTKFFHCEPLFLPSRRNQTCLDD